jgi:ubiquinone/menaquinone biosynthesis C-methylase UbiE
MRTSETDGSVGLDHSQFGKFRHANGRSALPKRPHGAKLSVQSPIIRGMPVEAPSAICTASRSGLFSRGESKATNLVNVHIHQFQPGGAVVDASALAQFQEQWATYRKLVENDSLAHREVSRILRETLNDVFTSPFCFLDIACGDGSTMKAALRGTQVRHYHGIDLSQAALDLAAANLAELPFEVELDHRDFVEAMMRRPEHADATWCSLSIHHLSTDDKLHLMKAIRSATGARGIFLLYEPTRRVDEDRAAYLDRFMRTNKPLWRVLIPAEWDQIWHHVTTCDFPETAAVWCELGREAGFGEAREVFVDPTDFFRLFRFEG